MKAVLPIVICLLPLVSCGKKQQAASVAAPVAAPAPVDRALVAGEYLNSIQKLDRSEREVEELRVKLDAERSAGTAQLLAIDLKSAMEALEKAQEDRDQRQAKLTSIGNAETDPDYATAIKIYAADLKLRRGEISQPGKGGDYIVLATMRIDQVMASYGAKKP